jgi:hypothetical protein
MSNLLSPDSKHQVLGEYRSRVYVVWCGVLAAALCIVALLFLPSYLSVHAELRYATTIYDKESAATRDEYAAALDEIRRANALGEQLSRDESLITMTDIMREIDAELSNGISFTGLSLSRPAGNPISVEVRGIALTRDELARFIDRLKLNPYFADVTVPFSQLAQAQNAPFVATLSIRPRATKEASSPTP